jgi:hypothetical protein
MSGRSRLVVAAAILVAGVVVALALPPGTCPRGGRLDPAGGGGYWCHVSDVGYAASSLIPLKIGLAIVAIVAAFILAVPVARREWAGSRTSA